MTREEIYDRVWSAPLAAIAPALGMSTNGLAKLCDRLEIPRPDPRFWTARDRAAAPRPPLPPTPEGARTVIDFSRRGQARQVRSRTRMSIESRRSQLLDIARDIALTQGVAEISLRAVARRAGISEAQAHNCFAGRTEMLIALAQVELAQSTGPHTSMRILRGESAEQRIVMGTVGYLQESAMRGTLLPLLMREPKVREGMRDERITARARRHSPVMMALQQHRPAMPDDRAIATNGALMVVCLRAGAMIAGDRFDSWNVTRLCVASILAGVRATLALDAAAEANEASVTAR